MIQKMRNWLVAVLCLISSNALPARDLIELPEPAAAPALKLPMLDGGDLDLANLRGQVVLLNFWASWCPPCRREMPSMSRLAEQLADQPFRIVAVNIGESKQEVRAFLEATPLNFPIVFDPLVETTGVWGVPGLPYSFLIDAEGRLRYRLAGDYEWDSPAALKTIRALLPAP
jgi:thiol-disulfide isomerase/thioredoxin